MQRSKYRLNGEIPPHVLSVPATVRIPGGGQFLSLVLQVHAYH